MTPPPTEFALGQSWRPLDFDEGEDLLPPRLVACSSSLGLVGV